MVKIKTSALVDSLKGTIGNITFSTGRSNAFARSYVYPIRTSMSSINSIQIFYSKIAGYWRVLSQPDKLAWQGVLNQYTFYDKYNHPYTPSAFQLFLKLNLNLFGLAHVPILTAQNYSLLDPPEAVLGSPTLSTHHFYVESAAALNVHEYYKIYISKWLPASQDYHSCPVYYCLYISPSIPYPVDLFTYAVNLSGRLPIAGEMCYTEVFRYNANTGQSSLVQAESSTVVS